MGWLIVALGLVLAGAGGTSILYGLPFIRLEFGWTAVIAGTTALSAGIVTFALASILFTLQALRRAGLASGTEPAGLAIRTVQPFRPSDPDSAAADRDVGLAPDVPPVAPTMPRAAPLVPMPSADPKARPEHRMEPLVRPPADQRHPSRGRPVAASSAPVRDVAAEPEGEPSEPSPGDEGHGPGAASPADAPTVMGRYESGGASYVLFSDGTIEVETDAGTHRFASMQDLKDYIARQTSA